MTPFFAGYTPALDANGNPINGAVWAFSFTGTTTPVAVTDADAVSLGTTVTADAAGRFANMYLQEGVTYRARLFPDNTLSGQPIRNIDPVNPFAQGTVAPGLFGVVGDGVTDDTAALQAWFDYCRDNGLNIFCPTPMICKITSGLVCNPAKYLNPIGYKVSRNIDLRHLSLLHSGSRNYIMLDIGEEAAVDANFSPRLSDAFIYLPHVMAGGSLSWPGTLEGDDTGIRLRNLWYCEVHCGEIYGFTKGLELVGYHYNTTFLNHIYDNRYGQVCTAEGSNGDLSFFNENKFYGGRIGCSGNAATLGTRYGTVLTWDGVASYRGHNNNHWTGITYEMGGGNAASTYEVPVWVNGVGSNCHWTKCRYESGKGPFAIVDGGGGNHGFDFTFEVTFNQDNATAQSNYVLQVNGACGNLYFGPGAHQYHWHSGDLSNVIGSTGGSNAYLRHKDLFFVNASTPTLADVTRTAASAAHRYGIFLASGGAVGVGICIDTSVIKDFLVGYNTPDGGLYGRVHFMAFDASWNLKTGNATDATWGDEPYVKACNTIIGPALSYSNNTYRTGDDLPQFRSMRVTVRTEVKFLIFMIKGGTNATAIRAMGITGFAVPNNIGSAYSTFDGIGAMRVFSLPRDNGSEIICSANPFSTGVHGTYVQGQRFANGALVTGGTQPKAYFCTTGGRRAPAWANGTAYVLGQLVANDTAPVKIYECTTAGTSAGSGGPTGTTATWDGIVDNTAKWRYVCDQAAGGADENLA